MTFMRRRGAIIGLVASVAVMAIAVGAMVALSTAREQDASAATVVDLPSELPRLDLPRALDGTAYDAARVGDWIVVGGDFTQLELRNGTVLDVDGTYAYNIDTGALNQNFLPAIDRGAGVTTILAVEPAPDGDVYLGGRFFAVNGHGHSKLTKISLTTGQPDTGFVADYDGVVRDLVAHDDLLYVGGEFETANGEARGRLAAVDAATGAVDAFRVDITDSTRTDGDPYGPKYLGVTDDDVLVVAHRANRVGGELRKGIALIDLTNGSVMGWSTDFWGVNMVTTVDAEVSPDGTYVVVAGDGGDFPFMGRDSAVAFSIADRNRAGQEPMWIARNFDSTYAVGISDDAVYLGGHFCWVESELAPDPWPGDGEFTNNNSCHGLFPAGRFAPYVVNRDQIAAVDPATGHALLWDPGSDGLAGVQSIEVFDRGLLIGHDGKFFGRDGKDRRAWNVGRHIFVDRLEARDLDAVSFIDVPVTGLCDGLEPTITGTTRDDIIIGTPGDDVILAGPGNDRIEGLEGNDTICGGTGGDRIYGGPGDDKILGDNQHDRIFGDDGHDTIIGGAGHDRIRAGLGNDTILGGRGDDRIFGDDGHDTASGDADTDLVRGNAGRDILQGGAGVDRVIGGNAKDSCNGDAPGVPDDPRDILYACEQR